MVVAGATDEVGDSLPAVVVSTGAVGDSCDDSVHPTVNAVTAPARRTTGRAVREKRMVLPFRFLGIEFS
jgi:hypothetical protein